MKGLQDFYTLSNGVKIPCVGFGTFRTPDGEVAYDSVRSAVEAGYRHIDTASKYRNEESVGRAIADCGVPREELFVTTKLWNTDQGYESTLKAFDLSMEKLGLDYLDLYLIHWPAPAAVRSEYKKYNLETWRAFEKLYKEGRIRAIGVSNFLVHHLDPLMEKAEIKPMVNQLEYHPGFQQDEIVAYCRERGILIESWGPLMQGKAFEVPLLQELAAKYGVGISQICIRWELQKGVLPLPKSTHPDRIRQNADVFGFEISDEDMEAIDSLRSIGSNGQHPDHVTF